jgi:CBS domain-containing protein
MLRAKDVMRARVITVGPETTIEEATRLFEDMGISGAPVVGTGRRLLGVVSRTDLLRRHQQEATSTVPAFYRDGEGVSLVRDGGSPGRASVAEVMTPAVLSAREDTPVDELARVMIARRIHRVVITRDDELRGIVTTMDLLGLLAAREPSARRAAARPARGRRGRPGPGPARRPTRVAPEEL